MRTKLRFRTAIWLTLAVIAAAPLVWIDTSHAGVEEEIAEGTKAGVRGTPSFFVGQSGSGETITGTIVRGAQPMARFRQVIEKLLKDTGSAQSSKPTP